jgi:hypothetical protein
LNNQEILIYLFPQLCPQNEATPAEAIPLTPGIFLFTLRGRRHPCMSVPATGNDTNDGTAPETAKGSLAGMFDALMDFDLRGHNITIEVSGAVPGVNNLVELPGGNNGSSQIVVSGGEFTSNVTINANHVRFVGCTFDQGLTAGNNALVVTLDCTFKNNPLAARARGHIWAIGTTTFSGNMSLPCFYAYTEGSIIIGGEIVFDDVTATIIAQVTYGGRIGRQDGTNGEFTVSGNFDTGSNAKIRGYYGGEVDTWFYEKIVNHPGGTGAVPTFTSPSWFNAKGTARAGGQVSADGNLGKSFGIVSVTKTGTGIYQIIHGLSNPLPITTMLSNAALWHSVTDYANSITTIRTFNASGTATDAGFNIEIF